MRQKERALSEKMMLACPSLQTLKAKLLVLASTGHRAHFKKRSRPPLRCGRLMRALKFLLHPAKSKALLTQGCSNATKAPTFLTLFTGS